MAYDEQLADRIRDHLAADENVSERKMFGGICFMAGGHMACGVIGESLMVRLSKPEVETALEEPHTRVMDFTGRPSANMVYVDGPGLAGDGLGSWVDRSVAFVATLPPKG